MKQFLLFLKMMKTRTKRIIKNSKDFSKRKNKPIKELT